MLTSKNLLRKTYSEKDILWAVIWFFIMSLLLVWNYLFLNTPSFYLLYNAFLNTIIIGIVSILFTALLGWSTGVGHAILKERKSRKLNLLLKGGLNLIRSIPQILGILIGYVLITKMLETELLNNGVLQIILIGFILSLFIFPEFSDLIGERIEHYKRTDFYPAMRSCGIKESRIINVEILWGNSLPHIVHKLVSVFGISVFLLCSIDFIISVGLSTEVSLSNFQITLGSLLAKMDSKQDILAISYLFSDPFYFPNLLFRHLQGISTGFIIVFTLICIYKISNGLIKRLP